MKSLPLLLSFAMLPAPTWAAAKLDIPIEVTPCTVITLPDGSKACEPPKVSQALPVCLRVTVRKAGKFVKYIWVCDPPRSPKPEPKKETQKRSAGGY